MSYSNISYVMPQADIDAVKAAITTINSKMPFLVTLTEDERKTLFKLGPKSVDFVQDCASAVQAFPGIFPPSFNTSEFTKDAQLFKIMVDIFMSLDSLNEKLNDTMMAVGSEAMGASLHAYTYVQTAADTTPGLKSVAEKIGERFKGQGKRKPAPVI
jgi:hypothetical protein